MSRNPIAAYTHRSGFRMGQVEFKDFLWEALLDPAADVDHGRHRGESRAPVPDHAAGGRCLCRAQLRARASRRSEAASSPARSRRSGARAFEREGYKPRGIKLRGHQGAGRPTPISAPRRSRRSPSIRPAFGGVQTGGNSSAIVDGAAAALVASADYAKQARQDAARRASSRARRSACRRRSWASARCRRSGRCSSAPG